MDRHPNKQTHKQRHRQRDEEKSRYAEGKTMSFLN